MFLFTTSVFDIRELNFLYFANKRWDSFTNYNNEPNAHIL